MSGERREGKEGEREGGTTEGKKTGRLFARGLKRKASQDLLIFQSVFWTGGEQNPPNKQKLSHGFGAPIYGERALQLPFVIGSMARQKIVTDVEIKHVSTDLINDLNRNNPGTVLERTFLVGIRGSTFPLLSRMS